jgi:pimeloyl-ACP methyl ester carboxylesterase
VIDAPAGFVVTVEPGDRIHFQDWGGVEAPAEAGVLLIHGLGQTAWTWAPVARRLAAAGRRVVAMDLRGHGLSDAPTEEDAYEPSVFADDVLAVAEGSGLLGDADDRVVLAGHGFGAMVAAWGAARLGSACAGLALVDGGWESMEAATGLDVDEFLRGLDEPPEVMRSMAAFLRDRRGWDPASWDADQEQAARASVVETHAGRVVPTTRPHVTEACVRTMFRYDPVASLAEVGAPVVALEAGRSEARLGALGVASTARVAAGRSAVRHVPLKAIGHNLMRYRPDDVTRELLALATTP